MAIDPIKPTAPPTAASSSAALMSAAPSQNPLPVEHVGTPTAAMNSPVRASFDASELRQAHATKGSHARSMSLADVALQAKRLSLNFPIQNSPIPQRSPPLRSGRPTSWALDPIVSALGEAAMASPTEGNFLTVIAGQERRVLELKDELKQAEEELKRLKDHYRKHEAFKKKNETVRRVQQLEPLNVTLPANSEAAEDDADGSSLWLQREMERRKALMNGVRTSNRKVFSGSRHTRTLSLLSPERVQAPSFPQPSDVLEGSEEAKGLPLLPKTTPLPSPAIDEQKILAEAPGNATITRDALLKTGKQMAADLKEGLWTFVEDLRQATVGEEAVNGTTTRSVDSNRKQTTSGKGNRSVSGTKSANASRNQFHANDSILIDIGGSFWREHGVDSQAPSPKKSSTPKTKQQKNRPDSKILTPQKPVRDFDDTWDTWDTPASAAPESTSSSATDSISESSLEDDDDDEDDNNSSTRTSSSLQHERTPQKLVSLLDDDSKDKHDGIPWPSLVKLSPSHLRRTATQLMNEFEKTLSPTPDSKERSNYLDAKDGSSTN